MKTPLTSEAIRSNPTFMRLVRRRGQLSIMLTLVVLLSYYGFIALIAFKPAMLHTPLNSSSPMSIGWPIGLALILGSWLLTGVYLSKANNEFDDLNAQLLKEIS